MVIHLYNKPREPAANLTLGCIPVQLADAAQGEYQKPLHRLGTSLPGDSLPHYTSPEVHTGARRTRDLKSLLSLEPLYWQENSLPWF